MWLLIVEVTLHGRHLREHSITLYKDWAGSDFDRGAGKGQACFQFIQMPEPGHWTIANKVEWSSVLARPFNILESVPPRHLWRLVCELYVLSHLYSAQQRTSI